MQNIVIFIILLVCLYLIWRELKAINQNTYLISNDTRKKEELNDALDKFAALYIAKKGKEKIVSFKTKDEDDQ